MKNIYELAMAGKIVKVNFLHGEHKRLWGILGEWEGNKENLYEQEDYSAEMKEETVVGMGYEVGEIGQSCFACEAVSILGFVNPDVAVRLQLLESLNRIRNLLADGRIVVLDDCPVEIDGYVHDSEDLRLVLVFIAVAIAVAITVAVAIAVIVSIAGTDFRPVEDYAEIAELIVIVHFFDKRKQSPVDRTGPQDEQGRVCHPCNDRRIGHHIDRHVVDKHIIILILYCSIHRIICSFY